MDDDPIPYGSEPLIGPWMGRLGMVRQILNQPCTPTPMMWVNGFFYGGAPKALWTLLKPGPRDYLDIRRPRSGPAHGLSRRWTFDVQEVVESPPLTEETSGWIRFDLSSLVSLLLRSGWYFLLADTATNGLLYWTSLAMKYAGCDGTSQGYLQGHLQPGIAPGLGNMLAWIEDGSHVLSFATIFAIFIPAGINAYIGLDIQWGPDFGHPDRFSTVTVWLEDLHTGQQIATRSTNPTARNGMQTRAVTKNVRSNTLGRTFIVKFNSDGGVPTVINGTIAASADDPMDGIGPDP